jgi:glycosyltransferase involved in cell wall biosynthesis
MRDISPRRTQPDDAYRVPDQTVSTREPPYELTSGERGPSIAIVHDYLTQRGGAERVVLSLLQAFPGSKLYTSLYEPDRTFPEFRKHVIHTMPINRFSALRRHHRRALPLLATSFSRTVIDADVVLCSSSGWAHGVSATGRKVVYCYTPPRWLYTDDYLGTARPVARMGLATVRPSLVRWDNRAARSADRYVCISTAIRNRIRSVYGIDAEVVVPPHTLDPHGPCHPVPGVEPGFFLCVARLLPYKNVDSITKAFRALPDQRLVIVGDGPERARLQSSAPANATLLSPVSDGQLRWLYKACRGLVAAAHEDFGLAPVEAASFGRPAAVLGEGGFLDSVAEGKSGVFFDEATPAKIAEAIRVMSAEPWNEHQIVAHAQQFSEARFIDRIQSIVADERAATAVA